MFFSSAHDHRAQNSRCGYTASSFHTAWVKTGRQPFFEICAIVGPQAVIGHPQEGIGIGRKVDADDVGILRNGRELSHSSNARARPKRASRVRTICSMFSMKGACVVTKGA